MAALGMTQAEAGIGLSMFLGKAGISENDRMASIHWLAEYAKKNAPAQSGKPPARNSSLHADHRQVRISRLRLISC
jgi:hypothetical protein